MKNSTLTNKKWLSKGLLSLLILVVYTLTASSQQNVGISSTGTPPNASAGLDINFPDKGLLIPRVALSNTSSFAPLSAHVAGMIVYNTATAGDVTPGYYYNNGSKWIAGLPAGNTMGDMLYWNGSAWVRIPAGLPGQILQFTGANIPAWGGAVFATISTTSATSVTANTASSGGNITNDGGSPVLSRGVCWKTTTAPTIGDSKTSDGTGTGIFTSNITGLSPMTTYYVRAYATNSSITSYGNEITFTTLALAPTVTTTATSAITATTATSGGNVTSDGGAAVTARGVCWSTTTNPTVALPTKTVDGSGTGTFVSSITGITSNTLYYVRAYATNSVGTSYGTQVSFTSLMIPPTLTTTAASSITSSSVSTGGTITQVGTGGNLWDYGVAYSTVPAAPTPTYYQTGTYPTLPFTYVTNIPALLGGTTYYIRACLHGYWNGASATIYGNELSFTTLAPVVPTLTTTAITSITSVSAASGGSSLSDGGAPITAKGVCWNTTGSPTIADNFTSNGTGNGNFSSALSGLSASTTYYVRAYATNSVGTGYGNELSFTTCATPIYSIGQSAEGGIIFYVDCTGQHGLVASLADQGTGEYGCSGVTTGATGTAIYSGFTNTTSILSACATVGIAARLCDNYVSGIYTDWYLPSTLEMAQMNAQKSVIPGLQTGTASYWSSTEISSSLAYSFSFQNGTTNSAVKSYTAPRVRAIRKF